ncbi:MAG: electron transfer flavoprotein subunit beta/FixA family protein [Oscillospiraceae bacterium]
MNIAVCIKQVPASSVQMDKSQGVLMRSMAGGVINPWDLYAVESALQIAEKTNGVVTAISMGPASAEQAIRYVIAMGVQKGVLMCDDAFAGSDVYATAFTLSQGLKVNGEFDLIICGQQTTDGDTSQLPFSLATQMNIPAIGWVKKIESATDTAITVLQELSGGTQKSKCAYPAVVVVGREVAQPRIPNLKNKLNAKNAPVKRLGLADLPHSDAKMYGSASSPTQVVRVYENNIDAKSELLRMSGQETALHLLKELECAKHE